MRKIAIMCIIFLIIVLFIDLKGYTQVNTLSVKQIYSLTKYFKKEKYGKNEKFKSFKSFDLFNLKGLNVLDADTTKEYQVHYCENNHTAWIRYLNHKQKLSCEITPYQYDSLNIIIYDFAATSDVSDRYKEKKKTHVLINGVLLADRNENQFIYFEVSDNPFGSTPNLNNIKSIMLLDANLFPIKRLVYCNKKLLYKTELIYTKDKIKEIIFYPYEANSNYELNNLSLKQVYILFQGNDTKQKEVRDIPYKKSIHIPLWQQQFHFNRTFEECCDCE
ncbi:hypothetical protein [Thermoflexibacter ruber]|uniref:Uncharacterized protein n=1 Tax=Thermoflexibacter ruber TaxID=1003 RepID=A0A1I2JTH5_9BACT|nr:hypothetical protein [Thermoflexibacter ruber]SFF57479.1 hypothetical protein SAMN04488541_10634 [Thermoflexibacter ruber]